MMSNWVRTLRATPDPRGDVVVRLRHYRGLPAHIPNRRYLYTFLTQRLKLDPVLMVDIADQLYADYQDFLNRQVAA